MGERPHHQLRSMLKVGFIGFGGGSALIPIMEKELVGKPGGLDQQSFTQHTVIANITPGALPVKLAALSGVQLGGAWSAVLSALIVALPGAIITVGLIALFAMLGPGAVRVIEFASLGITAFIVFLLAHYIARVIRSGGRRAALFATIAIAVFSATGLDRTVGLVAEALHLPGEVALPELSAVTVIVLSLAAIGAVSLVQQLRNSRPEIEHRDAAPVATRRIVLAAAGMLVLTAIGFGVGVLAGEGGLLSLLLLSTVTSFGGGEAYVGVADGFFVAPGLIDSTVFYGQIVPVANALPGPILVKVAAAVAFVAGEGVAGPLLGAVLAGAAYLAAIGACCALALALLGGYDRARRSIFVVNIGTYILPVICGLLLTTAVSMLHTNAVIAERADVPVWAAVLGTLLITGAVALLHRTMHVPDLLVIAACGILTLAVLSAL